MKKQVPPPAALPDTLELDVHALSHDGRAVCRHDKCVIFVRGGLPGQRILARITESKKNFAEGVCESILRPAEDAVPAPCAHADQCGGCPLQQMPATSQLYWKERILRDALARIGKVVDAPMEAIIPSPRAWGYRNKMEFAFGQNGNSGELTLGLRHSGSHEICDIRHCLLLPPGGMEAVDALRQLTARSGLPPWIREEDSAEDVGFWRFAVIRMPEATLQQTMNKSQQLLVNCITAPGTADERAKVKALGVELMRTLPAVTGFVHEERRSSSLLAQGEHVVCTLGHTELHEKLGGMDFVVDHGGFFQVNTGAAEHLCALARDMAGLTKSKAASKDGAGVLWDLYCGVGAPGLCMAAGAEALHGVEFAPHAVDMAKRNAAAAGFAHCQYEAGDVRVRVRRLPHPQVVLLDPPRAGLHPEVVKELLRAAPRRIVYISCNPATLARDVALLAPTYKLARVVPVDLFPQTPHVESVSLLLPA